jgi:VWFA-related protein
LTRILLLCGVIFAWGQTSYSAPFQKGDVVASVNHNQIRVYSSAGLLKQTLDTKMPPGEPSTAGSAFDKSGNLYVTTFMVSTVAKFDSNGALLPPFVSINSLTLTNPESILFDAAGNAYVGDAGRPYINKFSSSGAFLERYTAKIGDRGTDWIDLAADQKTMFYTSEDDTIRRYDVAAKTQLADFAKPGGVLFALRILPDGGLLVAHTTDILRIDASGKTIQKYTAPNESYWFALNLDPDGTSFWSADLHSGNIYKFDIASGKILQNIATGAASFDLAGVSIYGEITASGGQTNTGGAAKLETAVITNKVPAACGDFTPASVTSYLPTDPRAYLYFLVRGAKGGDVAESRWLDPSGKTYTDGFVGGKWNALPKDGDYCFKTDYLDINGKPAANLPGTWTVQVLWNGATLATLKFTIGAASSGSLNLVINQVDSAKCPIDKLIVTVTDDQGRPVSGLTSSNFTLKEDGQVRAVTVAGASGGSALSVALVLDTSYSIGSLVTQLQTAAKNLVTQLPAAAQIALYTFSTSTSLVQDFTTDRAAVTRGIDKIAALGDTAIYDAIATAVQRLRSQSGRRVIVLETDGDDNSSKVTVDTAILQAQDAGVSIFVVGVGDGIDDRILKRIAQDTGGAYRAVQTASDLATALQALGQTIANGQYEITYTSGGAAGNHTIELQVTSGGASGIVTRIVAGCGAAATDGVLLTVESVSGAPGQAVDVPVSLQATGTRPASFQLDVSYDSQLVKFNSVRAGDQLTRTGKDVSSTAGGNKVTLIGAGLNQNVIGDGTVALMNFSVNPNAAGKAALTCSNPLSVDAQSKALKTTCVSGAITIGATCSCDVNGDGAFNVGDVQLIINQVMGKVAGGCDLNGDGQLNVLDIQIVINSALGQGCKR